MQDRSLCGAIALRLRHIDIRYLVFLPHAHSFLALSTVVSLHPSREILCKHAERGEAHGVLIVFLRPARKK